MTINVAFKIPDAVVFVTDGLGSISSVAPSGDEHIISSMNDVEKLVSMRGGSVLAMFNGVGSLGSGTIASELKDLDDGSQEPSLPLLTWASTLSARLADRARKKLRHLPRPFHLILAGFDPSPPGTEHAPEHPQIYSVGWPEKDSATPHPDPVLHELRRDGGLIHRFGAYYAGATVGPARFAEGFDPELPARLVGQLVGGEDSASSPGLLEELVREVCAKVAPQAALSNAEVRALALKYAGRTLQRLVSVPETPMSEHYSLQAAINYAIFLAACSYAQENWYPGRTGPARVGSALQVGYLRRHAPAELLASIRLDAGLKGFVPAPRGVA